ncbi:reverse transcriptase domain-containing protein [Tanacetum coccineum]
MLTPPPKEKGANHVLSHGQGSYHLSDATNNEAEYRSINKPVTDQQNKWVVKNPQAHRRPQRFGTNKVNGSYVAKESGMVQYLEKVKTLTSNFKEFSIKQVPWSENKKADALRKIASTSFAHLSKQVLMEELNEKSINEKEVLRYCGEEDHIMDDHLYASYPHQRNILPKDKK